MNPSQIKKFHDLLVEAADKHLAQGGTIISGTFGSGTRVCPIEAMVPRDLKVRKFIRIRDRLDEKVGFKISDKDFWLFVNTFDGYTGDTLDTLKGEEKNPVVKMALRLRKKYMVK